MSALAGQLARYLETRQHTLSTAHLPYREKLLGEAEYVLGEAGELRDAMVDLFAGLVIEQADGTVTVSDGRLRHVRHELADVVLAATVLAGFLDTTIEACIAEKTELDRGRG